jgi:hypothetical protein
MVREFDKLLPTAFNNKERLFTFGFLVVSELVAMVITRPLV